MVYCQRQNEQNSYSHWQFRLFSMLFLQQSIPKYIVEINQPPRWQAYIRYSCGVDVCKASVSSNEPASFGQKLLNLL